MKKDLRDYIRNHPVVILGGCVLLGITLTGGALFFVVNIFDLKVMPEGTFISKDNLEEKYVQKSEYDRLREFIEISIDQERQITTQEIVSLREGFKFLTEHTYIRSLTPQETVLSYNFHAKRFNKHFKESPIPVFPERNDETYAGAALKAAMQLAITIIEGQYLCTKRS